MMKPRNHVVLTLLKSKREIIIVKNAASKEHCVLRVSQIKQKTPMVLELFQKINFDLVKYNPWGILLSVRTNWQGNGLPSQTRMV